MRQRWMLPSSYLILVVLLSAYTLYHPVDHPGFSVGFLALPWIIFLAGIHASFWIGFCMSVGLNLFILSRIGAGLDGRHM